MAEDREQSPAPAGDRVRPERPAQGTAGRAQRRSRAHGIVASRLETKGYGKLKPRYPNTTEENRARNRRLEIVVVK